MTRIVPAELPPPSLLNARTGAVVFAKDFKDAVEGANFIYSAEGYRTAAEPNASPQQVNPGVFFVLPWWIVHPVRHVYTEGRFRFRCRTQGNNFKATFRFFYSDNVTFVTATLNRPIVEGFGMTEVQITLDVGFDVFRVEVTLSSHDAINPASVNTVDVIPNPLGTGSPSNPW
jgi:hypothetical protein